MFRVHVKVWAGLEPNRLSVAETTVEEHDLVTALAEGIIAAERSQVEALKSAVLLADVVATQIRIEPPVPREALFNAWQDALLAIGEVLTVLPEGKRSGRSSKASR